MGKKDEKQKETLKKRVSRKLNEELMVPRSHIWSEMRKTGFRISSDAMMKTRELSTRFILNLLTKHKTIKSIENYWKSEKIDLNDADHVTLGSSALFHRLLKYKKIEYNKVYDHIIKNSLTVVIHTLSHQGSQIAEARKRQTIYERDLPKSISEIDFRLYLNRKIEQIDKTRDEDGFNENSFKSQTETKKMSLHNFIQNKFPLPLALLHRKILNTVNKWEKLELIITTSEKLTAYLAILALILAQKHGISISRFKNNVINMKKNPKQGLTFGAWKGILEEIVQNEHIQNLKSDQTLHELSRILKENGDYHLNNLYKLRNDNAHNRLSKDLSDLNRLISKYFNHLEKLYQKSSFLSDYPLRFISDFKYNPITEEMKYDYIELIGDHEDIGMSNSESSKILGKNFLYIYDTKSASETKLVLINPWITRFYCKECRNYKLYILDKWKKIDKSYEMRSLSCNHPYLDDGKVEKEMNVILGIN